ncbi:GAS2-like protein pickled eggs isoform X3 [Centruroides sculpturatus]|uniref:GAS2-like protein pickled eggs isoform X3 n=1 Tax=Centruroides sculpturatus TaxID=218467 RepID=UPI000C6EFC69|nr:GAS2-like protein pickled eggs isoform X3 [Centruroides sculpturatus]
MAASWQKNVDFSPDCTEEDLQKKIALKQEQHLIPLKEDLAEWLNKTLEIEEITADNFLYKLDNGVIVCHLAQLIQKRAEEYRKNGLTDEIVPTVKFKCWENAKSKSFYARDNAENFLKWCRKFGVHEAVIFESDGLVLHTQTRAVVLCLLELGRIAAKYGMEPPGLVKLEKEIEEQEENGLSPDLSSTSESSFCLDGSSDPLNGAANPLNGSTDQLDASDYPLDSSAYQLDTSTDAACSVIRKSSSSLRISNGDKSDSGKKINSANTKKRKPSKLDQKVMQIVSSIGKDKNEVVQLAEGRYSIGGKSVFVRVSKFANSKYNLSCITAVFYLNIQKYSLNLMQSQNQKYSSFTWVFYFYSLISCA